MFMYRRALWSVWWSSLPQKFLYTQPDNLMPCITFIYKRMSVYKVAIGCQYKEYAHSGMCVNGIHVVN